VERWKKRTPDILTATRAFAAPFVGLLAWGGGTVALAATALYAAAAATDWLDGRIARTVGTTRLGQIADPIADKILGAIALVTVAARDGSPWVVRATAALIARDLAVSGLREAVANEGRKMPPTKLAKWKTAAQMGATGFLLAGAAGDGLLRVPSGWTAAIGTSLLLLATGLALATAWGYGAVALHPATKSKSRMPMSTIRAK
jgi:cardiolipin synthase